MNLGVFFDAAAAGTGSVGLTVASPDCPSFVAPIHTITIQTINFRFPIGMAKGTQLDLLGMPYTPDGYMSASSSTLGNTLIAAQQHNARIVVRVTGGNDNFQTNMDSMFVLSKWKTAFDRVKTFAVSSYLSDGTLIGHYAIDEPFHDFHNMTGEILDSMCQYQKTATGTMWQNVPCVVRELNTTLNTNSPTYNGVKGYKYVDAGWAQLTAHAYIPLSTYNGNMGAYFRTNLSKGREVGLGLMYGFNLLNGGAVVSGCTKPDSQSACAMTAAELIAEADTLHNIGSNQGCGVIGWEIDATLGSPARDYFFTGTGIQSALQHLNAQVGGLTPGPC